MRASLSAQDSDEIPVPACPIQGMLQPDIQAQHHRLLCSATREGNRSIPLMISTTYERMFAVLTYPAEYW